MMGMLRRVGSAVLVLASLALPFAMSERAAAQAGIQTYGVNGCGSFATAKGPGPTFTIDQNTGTLCIGSGTSSQGVTQGITVTGNAARVSQEPTQMFWDDFGTGTLDTTAKWTSPTTGGGGNATAATNATGFTVLGSGNQASGWSILSSQFSFPGKNPSWNFFQEQNNVEFPVLTNALRFFGFGTFPGGPTTAAPYTNAVGFEFGTDGKLRAVTAASGTRNVVADLSVKCPATGQCSQNLVGSIPQPQDANVHKYIIYFRGDNIYWAIDGIDNIVAQTLTGALGPDVNTLPIGHLAVAGTTPPTSTALLTINQTTIGDTGRNEIRICDPTNPWRCAKVDANGNLSIAALPPVTAGIAPYVSAALESCHVMKASQATAINYGVTTGATAGFLMVFNATSAPGDGAVTPADIPVQIPANATVVVSYSPPSTLQLSTGFTVCFSSTGPLTKTASATAVLKGTWQ